MAVFIFMDIILNGIYEKSILLSNQQEILSIDKSSSETYTQSFPFDNFNSAKPSHIKKYDNNFLD